MRAPSFPRQRPRLSTLRCAGLALSACSVVASCKAPPPRPSEVDPTATAPALTLPPATEVDAAPPVIAARCKAGGAELAVGTDEGDLDIGEAAATRDGFAVGVIHKTKDGMIGGLALVSRDVSHLKLVDLAPPNGDALPPRPFVRGVDLFAAFYDRPEGKKDSQRGTRVLHVYAIGADGKATVAAAVAQENDESLAFDVAFGERGGLVAWDEDAIGLKNGDIKVATLDGDRGAPLTVGATRIGSPIGTDAELPRVVARHGGYWLVWVASKPEESPDARADPNLLEGPGEVPSFHWLEVIALDDRGAPVGTTKKLTPATGHVAAFDLAPRAGGDVLDVIARDDDEAKDGSGGRILRITVRSPVAADPPLALVSEAVGRGTPDLILAADKATSWLEFTDTSDRVRLVPLDEARAPLGPPSVEDALDGARPLFYSGYGGAPAAPGAAGATGATGAAGAAGATGAMLTAYPEDPKAQLRSLVCTP